MSDPVARLNAAFLESLGQLSRKRAFTVALLSAGLFAACSGDLATDPPTSMPVTPSGTAAAAVSLAETRITFRSLRDGNFEIYFMNADGSNQTRVTHSGAIDAISDWSPDGTRLVFLTNRDAGLWEIYTIGVDGSNPIRLTNNTVFETLPVWSPDGESIAYMRDPGGDAEVWVMGKDGSGQTNLTNSPGTDTSPNWSPDGTKLAFSSSRSGDREIYVMDADGSNVERLTNDPAFDGTPAWSPDGRFIAFNSTRDHALTEIYVMRADGTGVKRLTDNAVADGNSTWSPEGTKIAFHRFMGMGPSTTQDVYVMNADGSEQTQITFTGGIDGFPSWGGLPSSERVAAVIGDLKGISAANPGTPLADQLDDAIAYLVTAVAELNKTPSDNQAAVGNLEGAVGDLEAAVSDGLLTEAAGDALMDPVAGVARQLAVDALDQATECDTANPDLGDAQDSLDEGDELRTNGMFKDAVNRYKDALAKAEGVLASCP